MLPSPCSSPLVAVPALVLRVIAQHLFASDCLRLQACCRQLAQALSDEFPILPAYRHLARCIDREMSLGKIDRSDTDEWQEYYGFITAVNRFELGRSTNDWWNENPADAFLQAAIKGGAQAADGLPSHFTGLLMRDARLQSKFGNTTHQFEKVVALKMPDCQEAFLACSHVWSYLRRDERSKQLINIALALPGRSSVMVFHMDRGLDFTEVYSADRELAKALSVSRETVRTWLSTLCSSTFFTERSIWGDKNAAIHEASVLGDGDKWQVSYYLQDLLSIATALRTGISNLLSPEIAAAFNDLCRIAPGRISENVDYSETLNQSVQESSWAWQCLRRLVHDRRARRQVSQLPELYNALCVEHSDLLASEPAPPNSSLNPKAWVEANVRFTLFDDAEAERVEGGSEGQCFLVKCVVGPEPRPASFTFTAKSVDCGPFWIKCSLSFGVKYKCKEYSRTCGRFWHNLELSPAMFSSPLEKQDASGASGANSDECTDSNDNKFQDLWQRGDPHGDWGGPARFTLLMVALSLSFIDQFFKAGEPAAEIRRGLGRIAKSEQSAQAERIAASEDGDEHSSDYWTSDEEVDGEQEGLAFNNSEWAALMHYWEPDQSDSDEDDKGGVARQKPDAAMQRLAEYGAFREEQHAREMETDA
ncbi:hypothetical protein HDU88_001606 [Geranomyces variabilis]|nr:hypothetical protein HDU88_001606 [Geranomyces variabilis]